MLRAVEEFSVEETASLLGIPADTVKTRLFRARDALKQALTRQLSCVLSDTFPFAGARCDRMIAQVLSRLRLKQSAGP
jgi:RNA polymerase sigma-70 factor (ECF subfamily)